MLNNAKPKEKFVEGDAYDVRVFSSVDLTTETYVSGDIHSKSLKSVDMFNLRFRNGLERVQRTTPMQWVSSVPFTLIRIVLTYNTLQIDCCSSMI